MNDARMDTTKPEAGLQSADFIDRFAETMRSVSGVDLPHAYFVEEARMRLAGGTIHHLPTRPAKPAEPQSSACFDAWAKGDDAA